MVASGTWLNRLNPDEYVDAKYTTRDGWTTVSDPPLGGFPDELLELFIDGVEVEWGSYSSDHTYELSYAGTGTTLNAAVHDSFYGDNVGSLTVEIYEDYS